MVKKIRNIYEKTNLGILWFLNTFRYRQRLILVCVICKKAFKLFPDLANDYDNYIYTYIDAGQVSHFKLHNVTARVAIMYERILEYLKCQLFAKHDYLHITNPRNQRTMAE